MVKRIYLLCVAVMAFCLLGSVRVWASDSPTIVFMREGGTANITVSQSRVYGGSGHETVRISGASGVKLDGNIEALVFSANRSAYTLQIDGSRVSIYSDSEGVVIEGLNQSIEVYFADEVKTLTLQGLGQAALADDPLPIQARPLSTVFGASAFAVVDDYCTGAQSTSFFQPLLDYMKSKGYSYEEAELRFGDWPGMLGTMPDGSLQFEDPNADYGLVYFPDRSPGSYATTFQQQDVLLTVVCTPSKNNYYSYGSYIKQTSGTRSALWTSLGDALNSATIVTQTGGTDRSSALAYIATTGDQQSFADVENGLKDIYGVAGVNANPISDAEFHFATGGGAPESELAFVARRMPLSASTARPYIGKQRAFLFSKSGVARQPVAVDSRQTFSAQHASLPAFEMTFQKVLPAVISSVEGRGFSLISQTLFAYGSYDSSSDWVAGKMFGAEKCFDLGLDCGLDNRDDLYFWQPRTFTITERDFYLVVGLDYTSLGAIASDMATYSTVGAYLFEENRNYPAVLVEPNFRYNRVDAETVAKMNLSTEEKELVLASVFTVEFSKTANCSNGSLSTCLTDEMLESDKPIVFWGKASLNPETGTKPDSSQIVAWRLLHFQAN